MIDPPKPEQPERPTTGKVENFPSLTQAMRRARIDAAEQAQGFADLHSAEIARLELLAEGLGPVLEQVPPNIDIFDMGLVPGEHPRLFVDMIAFVQMTRDRRTYQFVQDRRDGRVILAESTETQAIIKAITDYIARRLIEREKALASLSDVPSRWPKQFVEKPEITKAETPAAMTANPPVAIALAKAPAPVQPPAAGEPYTHGWFVSIILFLVELLGVASLLALLIAAGFYLYLYVSGAS